MSSEKLASFAPEAKAIVFGETITVKPGVQCDTYTFAGDSSRDLAVVTVDPGSKTPLQRIVAGTRTVEGYMSGSGSLTICSAEGVYKHYRFSAADIGTAVLVEVGELMQWQADVDSSLVFYEICEPPYQDGRFENVADLD